MPVDADRASCFFTVDVLVLLLIIVSAGKEVRLSNGALRLYRHLMQETHAAQRGYRKFHAGPQLPG